MVFAFWFIAILLECQVILKSDDTALISEIQSFIATHPRMTRAIIQPADAVVHERQQHLPSSDERRSKNAIFPASTLPMEDRTVLAVQPTLTVTSTQNALLLDDIHLSVKTSKKFHRQRLDVILKTWFNQARKQVRSQTTFFVCKTKKSSACVCRILFMNKNRKINRLTDWLIDWLIDRLFDWLIDWLIEWLIDWLIVWLIDWMIEWLFDWLIDWLIDWSINRLIDWLIDWSNDWSIDWLFDWLIEWSNDCLIDWLIDWLID